MSANGYNESHYFSSSMYTAHPSPELMFNFTPIVRNHWRKMCRFTLTVHKYLHVLQQGRKRISAGSQPSGLHQVYVQYWLSGEMVWFLVSGLVLIKTQIPIWWRCRWIRWFSGHWRQWGRRGAMWHVVAAIPCADVLSNDRHNVTYQPTVTSKTYANLFHHPGASPRWWMDAYPTWIIYGQRQVATLINHA